MNDNGTREERIRREAYFIWLRGGMPEGRDKEHWEEAERTIDRLDQLNRGNGEGGGATAGAPLGPGQA